MSWELLAQLALAGVFGTAGVAKLADLEGSRRAARDFGLPAAAACLLGTALPFGELAIAVGLLITSSASWAALAACALLLAFSLGIVLAIARGRKPDCHCFGQLHSAPAGWAALIRNLGLAGVAALVAAKGHGASSIGWLESLSPSERAWLIAALAVVALIAGLGGLIWRLLRRHGQALERLSALEAGAGAGKLAIGEPAPDFDLPGLGGERVSLSAILSEGRRVLLVFTDPGCAPCEALLPDLGGWQVDRPEGLTIALVSRGSEADNSPARDRYGLRHIGLQAGGEVDARYGISGTPSALVLSPAGRVDGPLLVGAEEITAAVKTPEQADPVLSKPETAVVQRRGTRPDPGVAAGQALGAASAAVGVIGVAAVGPAVAVGDDKDLPAERIAAALGDLIRGLVPKTVEAADALGRAKARSPAAAKKVPAATLKAWRHRSADIDRARKTISRVDGAGNARADALVVLSLLDEACRDTELAITSSSAKKRNHSQAQQKASGARLERELKALTDSLRAGGARSL